MSANRFDIYYRNGCYSVSVPNYGGSEVVRADAVDRLLAALDREVDWINLSNEFRAARHAVLKQDK